MSVSVRVLEGAELEAALDDVARLRIEVFRDFPYLYDGDLEYERGYLATYRDNPDAVLVGAFDGARLVGAATGSTLTSHDEAFQAPLKEAGFDVERVFYCAESVLSCAYRGQGLGHAFFDAREGWARARALEVSAFCAVVRDEKHPARPDGYRSLGEFWKKRGYRPVQGAEAVFRWRDVGDAEESAHRLGFWARRL